MKIKTHYSNIQTSQRHVLGTPKKLRYNGKANEPFRILLEWVVSLCNYSNYILYIYILAVYHDYIISCSMEIYDGGIPGSPTIHQKIGGHVPLSERPPASVKSLTRM